MKTVWLPLIAEIEWSEGGRGQERPQAVRCGGTRSGLRVERAWTAGPAEAGSPVWRMFLARDEQGRRLRIRVGGEGATRVEIAGPG